ncbi:MAG: hypothetical protein J6C06_08090 [Lachnospiraceae bacterium]|nr:hypothetical protein [Lachnospiraceae bacterium]
MKKSERTAIIKWSEKLTDAELEKEYYDSVFDCMGSEAERMYELGYDIRDIYERERYEKYLCEKSDLLRTCCEQRGIEL